jgi:hypothetical protein
VLPRLTKNPPRTKIDSIIAVSIFCLLFIVLEQFEKIIGSYERGKQESSRNFLLLESRKWLSGDVPAPEGHPAYLIIVQICMDFRCGESSPVCAKD